jgi:hypothetical protein
MIPMSSIHLGPISHCTFRNPERPVQPVNWAFGRNSSDFFHLSVFFFSAAFYKYEKPWKITGKPTPFFPEVKGLKIGPPQFWPIPSPYRPWVGISNLKGSIFSDPSAIHNSLGVRFLPMLHLVILPLATETKDPSLMHCPSICRPFIGIWTK